MTIKSQSVYVDIYIYIYIYIHMYVCLNIYIHIRIFLIYRTNIWFVFFYHYNVQSHIPNVHWLHPGPSPSLPRFPTRPIDQGTICRQMYAAERSTWQRGKPKYNRIRSDHCCFLEQCWLSLSQIRKSEKPKKLDEEAYFVSSVSKPCTKENSRYFGVPKSGSLKHSHFSLGTLVGSLPLKAPPPWAPQPP